MMIMSIWLYRYSSNLASNNKRVDLFDGPAEEHMEENVLLASSKASKNLATRKAMTCLLHFSFLDLVLCYMYIYIYLRRVLTGNLITLRHVQSRTNG